MKGLPSPLPPHPLPGSPWPVQEEMYPPCSECFPYLLVLHSSLSSTVVLAGEYIMGEGILVFRGGGLDEAVLCYPCVSITSSN